MCTAAARESAAAARESAARVLALEAQQRAAARESVPCKCRTDCGSPRCLLLFFCPPCAVCLVCASKDPPPGRGGGQRVLPGLLVWPRLYDDLL